MNHADLIYLINSMFAGRIGRQIVLLQIMLIIILDTQGFQYFPTIPDFMDAEKQLSLPDLIMEIGKEQNCSLVVDPWQYYKFEFSSVDNRDLTKLRWQWRPECQKSNKFNNQNNNCTCITLFCTFLCLPCTTTTWNDPILSGLENGNGKAINFSFSL